MTEAAIQYNNMRLARILLRQYKGNLTQQEEACWSCAMDIFWQEMTQEERDRVEKFHLVLDKILLNDLSKND